MKEQSIIEGLSSAVAADWKDDPTYYDNADSWVSVFWNEDTIFRKLFSRLDVARIVDLACGRGRHSWQMRDWGNEKILVDVVKENIDICRDRFNGIANVRFINNNGYDLADIENDSCTSLFCYDAMVHFDHMVIFRYLIEINRILQVGGRALIHHSNNGTNPGGVYRQNPHWRNFMPQGLFFDYAIKSGFKVKEQAAINWGEHNCIDMITLVEKI
ncbi:MAG: class I SAM-dependent methyltransferase [Mesorhizobium sp.]|uniref:class I SAM-dependent methyltransferase n=1 Tax=Mesorhizobium sp. TaxID=1871066 RepID=UPI001ACA5C28|nr:class I SAM-dependent methyltransferase [Mesorhizobium sp.]MBN9220057.1 class I SAM-dependent methyltransferase [Mesorhizobium sp.]